MPLSTAPTLDAATRCCAIFGHPIRHSASPAMHNAAFKASGLNWCYLAYEVRPEHLREALEGARRMQFVGLNLTVPHKLLAMEMMAGLDDSAKQWGAVNTVAFEGLASDGSWKPLRDFAEEAPGEVRSKGYNTDAQGLTAALKEDLGLYLEHSRVMLLGAGGAGRVAALQLAEAGVADLFLVNRTQDKAEALAAEIQARYPKVHVMTTYPHREVDLVLNATSLGMKPGDALPMDLGRFPLTDTKAVYDMIYRPAQTPLMACAIESGARAVNGLGMLLHQGARAFEIWTGRPAPLEVMKAALREEVYGH
ncbi:MAG: shikimate dehydrogenase [Verrucomicrobia bacterium]|nr:shikimate dehydrogenase [Verrucomicrobiota bacterium]